MNGSECNKLLHLQRHLSLGLISLVPLKWERQKACSIRDNSVDHNYKKPLSSLFINGVSLSRARGAPRSTVIKSLSQRGRKKWRLFERCTCSKGSVQSAAEGAEFPFCEARNGSGGMLLGRRATAT